MNKISKTYSGFNKELKVYKIRAYIKIIHFLLASCFIQFALYNLCFSAPVSSITQEGITWTFDKPYETGQFANQNDWWVIGPVTIVKISPDFDGTYNGWEVNPSSTSR